MQVRVEEARIEEVVTIVEKPVIREVLREIEKITPYISESIKEIQVKITEPVIQERERITQVQTILEKVVVINNEIPRVYEVERISEKLVTVPQIVELPIEIPIIVRVNQIIESIRERPVEIPIIHQEIQTVEVIEEKVVAVEKRDTEVKEVVVYRDKIIEKDRLIQKTDTKNYIETKLQIVDRMEDRVIPVFSSVEKIVEVPYLLEKIVEKIVIMPQVVEVIKYIHEIVEESNLGVSIDVDVNVLEIRYKELYGKIRIHFDAVLLELRKIKVQTPAIRIQIETIEIFLIELDKLIQFPRFYQVEKEVIVEKEVNKAILVPTKDSNSIRNEIALSLLAEKLIG